MCMRMKAKLLDRIARTRAHECTHAKGAETRGFPAAVVLFPADERDTQECVLSGRSEMAKVPSDITLR